MATEVTKFVNFLNIYGLIQEDSDSEEVESGKSSFFVSGLEASQNGLIVGQRSEITFSTKLVNPASTTEVKIFETDENGQVKIIGSLVDNGDLSQGDDIAGDGVFNGRFFITPTLEGEKSYVAVIPGTQEQTEPIQIEIIAPISDAEFQQVLDLNTQIDQNFRTMLSSGQTVEQTLEDTRAMLQANSGVVKPDSIVSTNRSIAWETQDGILVVLNADTYINDGQRGGSEPTLVENLALAEEKRIARASETSPAAGCNSALVLAPYAWQFEPNDESNEIAQKLRDAGFNVVEKRNVTTSQSNITVDDFRNLDQYDVIAISTHGDNFDGTDFGQGNEVIFLTGQQANLFNFFPNIFDLLTKRLVLTPSNSYAVTSSFIDRYTGEIPDSIVYISSCRSTFTNSLANTFLGKGASAFIGYSDYVGSDFANLRGQLAFDTLLSGQTTGQIPGINVDIETDSDPAQFNLIGSPDATISIASLKNGTFEDGNFRCWTTEGDARIITTLGPLASPEGNQMAIVSTGLGSVSNSQSSISQRFLVPDNAKDLLIEYNVISEEPLEFVGTQFDDQFEILLNGGQIATERVNTSTWTAISGIDFFGGDDTVFETGFKNVTVDLTPFRGQIVELEIKTFDRGDSIYDTAALVDNIQITTI